MMTSELGLRRAAMGPIKLVAYLVVVASLAFGQGGNGTITGTVTDPAGAVVAGAMVEVRNPATGGIFLGDTPSPPSCSDAS